MFIKSLKISTPNKIIREIKFHSGLNLIIDDTPTSNEKLTGNNVGKTTVLKLVDFCLGADASVIYSDPENKKAIYAEVKDFLINEEVLITLTLVEDINIETSKHVVIERNFLTKSRAVRRIDGEPVLEKDFENELFNILISQRKAEKPTFRQIISHNIRYKDESINNTIKTLNRYTSDVEYEALYLLGCVFDDGAKKQSILTKIKQEETYKERLEKKQTKNSYEIALSMIEDDILELNQRKASFNLNEDFERDLDTLNLVKYKINKISSVVSNLNIRKSLIEEAKQEMEKGITNIDLKQLESLYTEATNNIKGIQKTFEDLVKYHNNMLVEKVKFITVDLPVLEENIRNERRNISELLKQEKTLSKKIAKGDSFAQLEKIIEELNEKYRLKGDMKILFRN